MSLQNVNVANLKFYLKNKISKVANILKSELSNFHLSQITAKTSIQMSLQNVNVANFNFILRIKFPKLQIS